MRDRLLRTTAEFDNYRKRIERDRKEMAERAAESVLTEILPIIYDLERALAAPEAGAEGYRRGVELIDKQLLDVLTRRGVTPIDTAGAVFDPHLHQAVSSEASADHREARSSKVPPRLPPRRAAAPSGDGEGSNGVTKRDYYEILGVARGAAETELKAAYRKWR